MRLALLLLPLLVLAACDGAPSDTGRPLTCDALGLRTDGQVRAVVFRADDSQQPFVATCTRASVAGDRIVVRGLVVSGALIEGDLVLTALGTAPGAYSIGSGQASARYAVGGQTYEAVEGAVALTVVSETAIAGAFDVVARDGVRVVSGEFTLPR